METRLALLRHTGYGPDHYDLMVQRGQVLWTWQFTENPSAPDTVTPLVCRRTPDHRLDYLDYEGPVPRHRGQVKRLIGGTCNLKEDGHALQLEISTGPMRGMWRLIRRTDENWELRKAPSSATQRGP